eukprot:6087772-Amphidinium_carterae.1
MVERSSAVVVLALTLRCAHGKLRGKLLLLLLKELEPEHASPDWVKHGPKSRTRPLQTLQRALERQAGSSST